MDEAEANLITYEESALEHIAKTADGGMRDSITLLDKAIGFSNKLTLNNVLEALGSVNYDTMFDLTDGLNDMNKKKVIDIVEKVHRSGLDIKQFIKQYNFFILDVCKYDLFRDFTYLQLPEIYKSRLDGYDNNAYAFFNQLLSEISALSNNLKYESMPKAVVEATFLQLCTEA
jgi:DNA polymerase-3 subunit gamma/tau